MTQKILSIMIVIFISFPITIYIVVYKQKPGHLYDLSILLENSSKNDQSTQESRQIQNKKIFIEEFLNEDLVYSIALDSSANILVTGSCYRKETDLDVYVSKFSSNGDFSWTTYLDGRFNDIGTDIAVDNKDNIIIAGVTWSTDFNTTPGAIRRPPQISSESNLFVTKFEPSGTMMWSTCLGGSGYDSGITSLAIDSQNNLIIVGSVDSGSYDFNISSDCYDPQPNGDDDVFVTKINENGSLIWSTYLGGSSVDYPTHPLVVFPEQLNEIDVVIDSNDNIIISSSTESDDFPTTENAFNRTYGGGGDIFLSKFNSTGFPLWSTFVGGSRMENGHSVTVDNNDHILITGGTYSPNFPTKNAFSETKNDGYDIFLSKFSSTGSLLWSTYLGGKNDDIGYSVAIDSLNSVYITGRTKSDDYLTTESAYDITFGKGSIFGDAFLTKLTTSGEVVWSTYIGGENDDAGAEVIIDNENNLLIVGNTASPDLESYNTPFRFSFGGEKDGFMSKFQSTGEIISLTRALVVTEPNSDPDNDGLNNMKEFRESTDPLDPDTDNDDIEDGIELENGLDPLIDDANEDNDYDGLTNLDEILRNLNVSNSDSDGDGMDDWWENEMGLNNYHNDTQGDKDRDGIPNYWEYEMGLHANYEDHMDDPDNDGLTNLEEFQYGINHTQALDPHNPDTDDDGMLDGWEVKYQLDPLDSTDVEEDSDNDFFPNRLEYQLRGLGFNPQSPIELYVVIFLILFLVCLITGFILRVRNLNKKAKLVGFENNADRKTALKAGFKTVQERSDARNSGFLTAESYNLVRVAGWFNVQEMVTAWQSILLVIKEKFTDEIISDSIRLIDESTSPVHLKNIESKLESFFVKIDENKKNLIQINSLQQTLIVLYQTSKIPPLVGLTLEELNNHYTQTNSLLQFLIESEDKLNAQISQKKEEFAPWPRLLTLVQLTEDGTPVKLSEIAKIIDCSEEQAEHLIILLLKENKLIGKYDTENEVYIKGHDVSTLIQTYIKEVKEVIEDFEK